MHIHCMPSREAHGRDCLALPVPFPPTQLFSLLKPDIKAKQSSAQRKHAETHTDETTGRVTPCRTNESKNSGYENVKRCPPSTKEKCCTTEKNHSMFEFRFFPITENDLIKPRVKNLVDQKLGLSVHFPHHQIDLEVSANQYGPAHGDSLSHR